MDHTFPKFITNIYQDITFSIFTYERMIF